MKIIVVGGVAHSLTNFRGPLLKTLREKGHNVLACAPDADPNTIRVLTDLGVRYCHIPISRTGLSPIGDFKTLAALGRLIKQEKPDKILAYTVKPVIYSHLAARLAGRPQIYAMITGLGYAFGNGSFKQRMVGAVVKKLYRSALKYSSGVLFQNPDDKQVFLDHGLVSGNVPLTIINGSGVDLDWYTPRSLPKEPVFLLVARLLAEKGVRQYYHAAGQLRKKFPQARFLLAGAPDSNPDSITREELNKWEQEGAIEYLGRFDDIRTAFAQCSVYVLPSYREGTPRSVLEAMAMGRPVITTVAPGCRETVEKDNAGMPGCWNAEQHSRQHGDGAQKIIAGKNGFLVPARDVMSLASAMERFIKEPELAERMGKESLRIAREKYDVHKVNKMIMEAMCLV